jgi:dihydroorotase
LVRGDIVELVENSIAPSDDEEFYADGMLVFPGLIDCHVHFREPGLEHKSTMKSESASAIAGGVLTVCEMPNTIPPTVTVAAFADKVRRASGIKNCDIRFYFGATELSHLQALRELFTSSSDELTHLRARCSGLKLYFDHSTGNQGASDEVIEEAFKLCAEIGITIIAHCEDAAMNDEAKRQYASSTNIADHSLMRPAESEARAIERAIGLAKKYGTRFHVAHLSTKQGVALVKAAKSKGLPVSCEVAPHHLFLTTDDYATLGTFAKMNPPLRTVDHRDALWKGIEDGTVDCIATDHAPHTLDEKKSGEPLKAPSGVPGVETMLPLLLTVAAGKWPHPTSAKPSITLDYTDIARLCFENPNRIFTLRKSPITEGVSASLVVVDPKAEWTISGKKLKSACGWTPFEGWNMRGGIVTI